MDEYTPHTDDVRDTHYRGVRGERYPMRRGAPRDPNAEFDRWHRADRVALIQELAFSGYFGTNAQSNLLRIAEIVAKGGEVPKI